MSLKKQKRLVFILSIILVFVVLVAIYLRYSRAWFESDSDPVIYSETMQIVSSEGLNIQLESQSETDPSIKEELNLKDVAKDVSDYSMLEQLSSANGVDLFSRKDDEGLISYTLQEAGKGYIEITILLINSSETTTKSRDVYLSDFHLQLVDSEGNHISNNKCAEDALRVSLEIEDSTGVTTTYIMGVTPSLTAKNRYDDFKDIDGNPYSNNDLEYITNDLFYTNKNAIIRAGISNESIPEVITPEMSVQNCKYNQRVYYASSFMKYVNGVRNNDCIILTRIPSGKNSKFTFRLWLEGSDPRCEIPISGTKIEFFMKFGNEVVD